MENARESTDTEEFLLLLNENEGKLQSCVRALEPNVVEADEVLQETWLTLWRQFDRFESGTDFGAWACTVARYVVLSRRKTKKKDRLVFSPATLDCLSDEAKARNPNLESRRSALQKCLDALDHQDRWLLSLRYSSSRSIRSICNEMGEAADAIYKKLARIRLGLQRCVERRLRSKGEVA